MLGTMNVRKPSPHHLAVLEPEPWGRRFKRAREDHAQLDLTTVAEKIARFRPVDRTTINRLEKLHEAPLRASQRSVAFLCCLIYGLDPEQFGLHEGDIPPGIREQVVASTIWKALPRFATTYERTVAA